MAIGLFNSTDLIIDLNNDLGLLLCGLTLVRCSVSDVDIIISASPCTKHTMNCVKFSLLFCWKSFILSSTISYSQMHALCLPLQTKHLFSGSTNLVLQSRQMSSVWKSEVVTLQFGHVQPTHILQHLQWTPFIITKSTFRFLLVFNIPI